MEEAQNLRPMQRAARLAKALAQKFAQMPPGAAAAAEVVPASEPEPEEEDTLRALERAEEALRLEQETLAKHGIDFRQFLLNLYAVYLEWAHTELGVAGHASLAWREHFNFCVARHLNQVLGPRAMGDDLECFYVLQPSLRSEDRAADDATLVARIEAACDCDALRAGQLLAEFGEGTPLRLANREFAARLAKVRETDLETHSMAAGLRGPAAYATGGDGDDDDAVAKVPLDALQHGEPLFPPVGDCLATEMLRRAGLLEVADDAPAFAPRQWEVTGARRMREAPDPGRTSGTESTPAS